jgi:D-mannonate dehydratase
VSKPLEIISEVVNLIDGVVSDSFNNKFVAMSQKFVSTINYSHFNHIEAKFDKQFSG